MQGDIEYDEMDLTPYEEDDDATLHKKLCAAKVARKRAEEDLKLLCNRIGLLKMEEGKVSFKRDVLVKVEMVSIDFFSVVNTTFLRCNVTLHFLVMPG